jgi:uncharacterized DUF497 family protein
MPFQFEWDTKKADRNLAKHGVAFEEALTVFPDPLARIFPDEEHSENERREIIIGRSAQAQILLISFVENEGRVRLLSARKATRRERKDYEEEISL